MPLHANRYNNIIEYVHNNFCDNLLEIGVCKGHTSIEILRWSKNPSINFYGIDLFEDIDEETFDKEVSIPADSRATVETYLKNASLNINLFKGFSNKVVDEIENLDIQFDVIFIDGGHDYKTVKKDFLNYSKFLSKYGIIVFHDIKSHLFVPGVLKFWNEFKKTNKKKWIIKEFFDPGHVQETGIGLAYKKN